MNRFKFMHIASAAGILACSFGPSSLLAQEFQGLGPAIPFGSYTGSISTHVDFISDDGSVLAGTYSTEHGVYVPEPTAHQASYVASQAFVWTQASGAVPLGVIDPSQLSLPPGDTPSPYSSYATGLSADGTTVVGVCCYNNGYQTTSFRWTAAEGIRPLNRGLDPGDGQNDGPKAVSQDGSIIVGQEGGGEGGHFTGGFQWTLTGGYASFSIPHQPAYSNSTLDSMSADGSVLAGFSVFAGPYQYTYNSFLWQDGAINVLPVDGRDHLSGDGSALVVDGGGLIAFWSATTGPVTPNEPDGSTPLTGFAGLSFDGTTIAALGPYNGQTHSFRWTISGGAQDLGFLPDDTGADAGTTAEGISADGNVIIGNSGGQAFSHSGGQAFIWSVNYGIWPLQFVLTEFYGLDQQLAGWTLTDATAISADGKTIAGTGTNPAGQPEAWVVQLPSGFN